MFTRLWLALFGVWPWDDLPALPPEVMLLPRVVPAEHLRLRLLGPADDRAAHRRERRTGPVRPLPFGLDELFTGAAPPPAAGRAHVGRSLRRASTGCCTATSAARCGRCAGGRWRRAERWIVARQEADGSWGGIQPPWVYSMIALRLQGYRARPPGDAGRLRRARRASRSTRTAPAGWRRASRRCWDTAWRVLALADAGVAPDDPALVRAADWLLGEEIRGARRLVGAPAAPRARRLGVRVRQRQLPRRRRHQRGRARPAPRRPSRPGAVPPPSTAGWPGRSACSAATAAGRRSTWTTPATSCRRLPFCDFGEVIDPPSADVTAHMVEMLGRLGRAAPSSTAASSGCCGRRRPTARGSAGGAPTTSTAPAPPCPRSSPPACRPDDRRLRHAIAWLAAHQNPDGGWGEDLRSYDDDAWRGRGRSTPSQTAWALLALLAVGDRGEATERGVAYLAAAQRADGTWDEPEYTGTGFPGDFYINYHLYRQVFPVMALGRYVRGGACA